MKKLKITRSWQDTLQLILEAEPQLTTGDVHFSEGDEDGLIKKLAEKLHRSEEQIIGWIESVSSTSAKGS